LGKEQVHHLPPLFNKEAMQLPPRIEKLVMGMQDVDFELIYEPGKYDADHSTFYQDTHY